MAIALRPQPHPTGGEVDRQPSGGAVGSHGVTAGESVILGSGILVVRSRRDGPVRVKSEFPQRIREIENTWIVLSDGTRLAARIWLPVDAEERPVPALLEYLPYRKDDLTAERDALHHPYFAGHGYACIRVDMRGSGDSDGILYDEYLPQEQDDALEVLQWIASQPWCTGSVGMIGLSWGGFNGLQVAARRPPELKAVISLCSTDDRYADDVHYMGGCVLAFDMLPWASTMLARNALPPLPSVVGDRWRSIWLERLEKTPPYIEAWLSHQRRDAYWKHGSVCEDYRAITCPVYLVGGWADAYSNAIPRLLAGLSCPRKGLIGPWAHAYPYFGKPGPAIGFLQECLRWWDYWLKGIDTGIMDEPMLRAWMLDSVEPSATHEEWPGRWICEPSWPSPSVSSRALYLNGGTLDETPASSVELSLRGAQVAGRDSGAWCPYGRPGEFPPDQRQEDGLALTFTSAPLAEPLEILGFPEVVLKLAVDRPIALVAVRLCAVSPAGASTLITRGLLNLTHRAGHEQPSPLVPGEYYSVTVQLNAIAWSVPAGYRLRVAISPTYWPFAWPAPEPVTLRLSTGEASVLLLPVRSPRPEDASVRPFEPPETAPPLDVEVLRRASTSVVTESDVVRGSSSISYTFDYGRRRLVRTGIEYENVVSDTYTIVEGEPLSACVRSERRMALRQGDWDIRVETVSVMTADAESFLVTNVLDAFEGGIRVFTKASTFSVERDLV
jgi:putative CocE/NonD family hydrolase